MNWRARPKVSDSGSEMGGLMRELAEIQDGLARGGGGFLHRGDVLPGKAAHLADGPARGLCLSILIYPNLPATWS